MSYKLLVPLGDRYNLIVHGLATWRIAHMLVHEVGPFGILTRIRKVTGIEHDAEGFPSVWHSNNMLSCVWCTSVWVGLIFLFVPKCICELLSLSAIACILEERYGKS
jgi:hypothetical protein